MTNVEEYKGSEYQKRTESHQVQMNKCNSIGKYRGSQYRKRRKSHQENKSNYRNFKKKGYLGMYQRSKAMGIKELLSFLSPPLIMYAVAPPDR